MIGQTVSHYKILEVIGEGGMGVVYKAQDTRLDRPVALKFLPPDLTRNSEARERFIHEAKAASALQHPNICTIHDIDETSERQLFIVMDYYEGQTLAKIIERGPLPVDQAIDIATHVAQGLQKAHEQGIVHRDIKPGNIIVTKEGITKIVDFGLAKLKSQTVVTKSGSTVGTVAYMSPEQAQGKKVDYRTDIWSLGVVLYEMLTGRKPFESEYEQALVYSILNNDPRPTRDLRPEVPEAIEKICRRAIAKEPKDRYQTASEFLTDLESFRTGNRLSKSTRKISTKQRRLIYATAATVILIVVAVILFEMPRQVALPGEKSIAVLPFVDMSPQRDQDYFCDGMTEELINRLSNVQELRVPARTSAFTFKGKSEDIRDIGSKLNVRTVLEGSVRKAGSELRITAQLIDVSDGYHLWSKTYNRELKDVFAIQDEISSAIVNVLRLKLTSKERERIAEHPIDNVKAYDCYLKAMHQIFRFEEKSLDSAFLYLQTGIDIAGDNALLYSGMAWSCFQYANIGIRQEDYFERAGDYAKKALRLKPDLASALALLGLLSCYEDYPKNWHDAFLYNRKALAANPNDTRTLTNLATAYQQIGKFSEAAPMRERLQRLDPLDPWWHAVMGLGYRYDCQFGLALEQFSVYYRADSTNPMAQTLYSDILALNGKPDEAIAVIDRMGNPRNTLTVFSLLLKYALRKDKESAFRAMTPEFKRTCRRDAEWSYWLADRLSLLDEKVKALDWLENASERGFINYPLLQCDPFLNRVRGEGRYKRLIEWVKHEWEHFEVPK